MEYHLGNYNIEENTITLIDENGEEINVYGGTLDVTTGELVVDRRYFELNGVNYTFSKVDAYKKTHVYSNNTLGGMIPRVGGDAITKAICNYLPSTSRTNAGKAENPAIGVFQLHEGDVNQFRIAFPLEDRFSTWDKVKTWWQSLETPFTICIPLKEPLATYQLTPQEITSLPGENNVWADTGDTSITYYDNQTATEPHVDYSVTSAFENSAEALDKIDNLKIGGANLFRESGMTSQDASISNNNTDFTKYFRRYNGNANQHTFTKIADGVYQDDILLNVNGNIGICFARLISEFNFDFNSEYTISCWAKCTQANAHLDIGISYYTTSNTWVWRGGANAQNFEETDTWQHFSLTFKPDTNTQAICYCFTVVGTTGGSDVFSIRNCKLEKGNKATDWSPAPEDIDADIATAQSTADTALNRATSVYGTCSTAAGTTEKAVVCSDFVLFDGARIQVTFTTANTASAPTLNVNDTGAKAIYVGTTVTSSTNQLHWSAGSKIEFVYDGTGWILQNAPYPLFGTCTTTADTVEKAVACAGAIICKGTSISVQMTNTNTTGNASLNVGSTVARTIYANDEPLTSNSRFNWRANTTQKFIFDGQYWRMDDDSVKALATAYITEIDEDGIMVHPEDDDTSGWAISDAIQLFKNGFSYIKLWIENNIPKIRIGKEDQGHIILDNDSVDIRNDDTVLASFGATSVIGDTNDWHQTIAANQITFAKGDNTITYISPDKLYTINAEVADAFYISNYSIRNASDGKLVIGLRR